MPKTTSAFRLGRQPRGVPGLPLSKVPVDSSDDDTDKSSAFFKRLSGGVRGRRGSPVVLVVLLDPVIFILLSLTAALTLSAQSLVQTKTVLLQQYFNIHLHFQEILNSKENFGDSHKEKERDF